MGSFYRWVALQGPVSLQVPKRGNVTGHHKSPILPVPYVGFDPTPLEIGVNSLQWFSEVHLHPIGLDGGHAHRNVLFLFSHCKPSCLTWCRSWNELSLTMPSLYVVQHELATPRPCLDFLRPRTEPGEGEVRRSTVWWDNLDTCVPAATWVDRPVASLLSLTVFPTLKRSHVIFSAYSDTHYF